MATDTRTLAIAVVLSSMLAGCANSTPETVRAKPSEKLEFHVDLGPATTLNNLQVMANRCFVGGSGAGRVFLEISNTGGVYSLAVRQVSIGDVFYGQKLYFIFDIASSDHGSEVTFYKGDFSVFSSMKKDAVRWANGDQSC